MIKNSKIKKQLTSDELRAVSAYIDKITSTWVQITDDSMLPALAPGDVVQVQPLPAEDGDLILAEIDGELIVRRLIGDELTPDNKNHEPLPRGTERILGCVTRIIKSV